jgi:homogentisate 1,2-dioxygenase
MHQFFQGKFTKQAHKGIPEGHFEEEQGRKGFFGPVSHLIKPQPSTRWTDIEGPLKPMMFDLVKTENHPNRWQRLLYNRDVGMEYLKVNKISVQNPSAFRNADADTIYFCHSGNGKVLTEYGLLEFKSGSYVLIPKCVTHTFVCESDCSFLVIESLTGAYREPDRGMVGRNAFYDPTSFGKPDLEKQTEYKSKSGINSLQILVKREQQMTKFSYSSCVYDTVGWKGDFFPLTLHAEDLMPMISARVHLPPSAHTTFVAPGFVVCTFLPRPLESDADALKVPFYHQNIDYDEVLFYHDGNFFSRDNLHAGMLSFHPAGFPHGPHPKAVKNIAGKTHTDEFAVMVDAWSNLHVDPEFLKVEVKDYWKSWMK